MYNSIGADLNFIEEMDLLKSVGNKEIVKQVVGSNCPSNPSKPFVRMTAAGREHFNNFVRNRILNKDYATISQLFDCFLNWCKWTNCEVSFKWYASNYAAKYKGKFGGVSKAFYKAFHADILDSDLFLEDGKVLDIPSTSDGNWVRSRSGHFDTGMNNILAPRKCYDITDWESFNTIESGGTVYDLEEPYRLTIEQRDDRSFVTIRLLTREPLDVAKIEKDGLDINNYSCKVRLLEFSRVKVDVPYWTFDVVEWDGHPMTEVAFVSNVRFDFDTEYHL